MNQINYVKRSTAYLDLIFRCNAETRNKYEAHEYLTGTCRRERDRKLHDIILESTVVWEQSKEVDISVKKMKTSLVAVVSDCVRTNILCILTMYYCSGGSRIRFLNT